MAITPDVIANYIANILGGSGSDAEKAAIINAAAQQYGVSREDINAATGYGMDQINAYLGPLSYAGSADDRQQDAIDAATAKPAETFQGGLSSISQPTMGDYSYGYTPQKDYTAPIDYSYGYQMESNDVALPATSNDFANVLSGNIDPPVSKAKQQQNLNFWEQQAIDAWNQQQAINAGFEPDQYRTMVSTYDDPYSGLPTVEVYMPGLGKSISVNARTAGVVSDDPTVNLNAAMSLVPQAQYALANNLDFLRDDKQIAAGVKAGTDTRLSAPVETLSFRDEDLATRKSAVNAYNASLYDVAPPVSDFEQQQNLRSWEAQAKYAQSNDPSYTSVSTYTDPNTGLPTVEIYMPSTGKSITVNARTAGIVSDDPTTNLNAAMALVPQAQYALANNLNFLTDDKKIASGLQTGAGTQITAPTEVRAYGDRFVAEPTSPLASVNYSDPIYTSAYVTGVFNRSDINDAEKAALINQYKTENNVSNKQIADAVGVSEDVVSSYLTPPTKAASTTTGALGTDTVTGGLGSATVNPTSITQQIASVLDPTSTGGAWTTQSGKSSGAGFGVQGMIEQLGQRLTEKTGITDLNQLGARQVPVEGYYRTISGGEGGDVVEYVPPSTQTEFYNKATGQTLDWDGSLGGWGQGPGMTYGFVTADPNGKLQVRTIGEDTTDSFVKAVAQAGPILNIANAFTGGALTPITMAVNAVNAIASENPFAIAASFAGLGGATGLLDTATASAIQTGANAANAIKQGNVLGALAMVAGSDLGANIGTIDLGNGITVSDALNAASAADKALKGDIAGALVDAGKAANSTELKTAGAALQLTKALESGNLQAISNAAQGLYNGVNQIVTKSEVGDLLINSQNIGAIDADAGGITSPLTQLKPPGSPTEDEQIALAQLNRAATSLVSDYVAAKGRMEPTDLAEALSNLTDPYGKPLPTSEINRLVTAAQTQLDTQTRNEKVQNDTLAVLADYTGQNSDLSRESAYERLVAAGNSGERANQILSGVDAQVEASRAARATTQAQNQAAIAAGAGEFAGADQRAAVAAGAGEFTGADKSAAVNTRIANATSFNDAYAIARQEFGPNATFNYQGKLYSTATAAERPDLAGATTSTATTGATADLGTPYVAPNGMHNRAAFIAAGGGTSDADYAKYVNAVNSVISQGQSGTLIKPSSVNSTGKELPATTGAVTMETPKVGSVLGSVVAQGAANFAANSIAGPLSALGFTDAGATVLNKANAIASAAAAAQGEDITRGKQEINTAINNVGKATNLKEAATSFGNVIYTAFKNPKAFAAEVGSEIVEEILQIGPLKGLPFWTREAIGSAVENGGAAYNQEYANQLQQGATVQDAHKNAQIAAGAASAASLAAIGAGNLAAKGVSVLTGAADDVIGGLLGKTKAVGKTTIKETIQEMGEEGLIAAAVDKAVRGETNPANILTGMAGGGLYAGPTSGTMQATGIDKLENAFDITSQIKLSIDAGSNLSTATNNVVASSLTGAINSGQDINTAASTIVVGALNAGSDPATVVNSVMDAGIKSGVDATAVINATVNSAISTGANTFTVIQTAVDTGIKSGADPSIVVTSSVNSAIKASASAAQNMGTTVDAIATSAVAAAVATATSTGANTTASIKAATDAAASTGITVKVDTSTNGSVKTTTAVTGNTSTSVSVDTSSKTTVTVTNDGNTSTKVVSTPTNTTTTTTDIKTGQSTTTTTNTAADQSATTSTTTNQSATTNTATDKNITTTNINAPPGTPSTGAPSIVAPPIVTTQQPGIIGETPITVGTTPIDLTPTIQGPTAAAPKTAATTTRTIPKTSPGMLGGAISGISLDNDWLKGQMLKAGKAEGYRDPLAQFQALQEESQKQEMLKQIDPELANVLAERGTPVTPYYSYGEEQPIEDVLGMGENKEEAPVFRSGGLVSPLNIQMMYAKGGRMREDFRHGKHVEGEGDGQSDDIPAWLADGEFVFPADVVSALGNGSTKAGTDKLYEMMHAIRDRARSKGPKDLPPPALKSPLDYLKKGR